MDTDLETEQSYRYTIGQFMNLNNGRVKIQPDMTDIFSKYGMPDCCKEQSYNNKHNIRFFQPGTETVEPKRKQISLRKREDAYDDSNILSEMRHAFSSVVKGSGGTIHAIAKLSQTLIPPTMVDEVAALFYNTIIQSPKQMPEYIEVLFSFRQPNQLERKIHYTFVRKVLDTFKNPLTLKTSPLESGADRTRKHRSTSCLLIASLFVYNFDPISIPSHIKPCETFNDDNKLREKLIVPMINQAKSNVDSIKNLANVWGILLPKHGNVLFDYKKDLVEIYKNVKFKLTSRIALKDYIDN